MTAERLPLLFGINVDPAVGREEDAFARARIADQNGIDLISVIGTQHHNARLPVHAGGVALYFH